MFWIGFMQQQEHEKTDFEFVMESAACGEHATDASERKLQCCS